MEVEDRVSASHFLTTFAGLARQLGIETSEQELRRAYALNDDDVPYSQLAAVISDVGFHVRRIELEWDDLAHFKTSMPAMIGMKDGTFLLADGIVEGTPQGTVILARDPATGDDTIALDEQRFARLCAGDIVLLRRRYRATDIDQPFGFKLILSLLLQEHRLVRDIGLASVALTFFAILPMVLMIVIMERVLVNKSYSTLGVLMGAVAIMITFEMILSYARRLFMQVLACRIDGRLTIYVLDRLMGLQMEFFEQNPTGLIQSKLSNLWKIRHFLTGRLLKTFLDTTTLVVILPILLYFNWALTLVVLALSACLAGIVYAYLGAIGRANYKVVRCEQAKNTHLVESIYGMRTIKSLALEGRRRSEWDRLVANAVKATYELGEVANQPETLSVPFERLIFSGNLILGAWLAITYPEMFSPGVLVAFVMLSSRAAAPLVALAQLMQDIGEVREAIVMVGTVVNAPPEISRAGTGLRQPIEGQVTFDRIDFRYSAAAALALDNATFTIPKGTIFGIMGRSGSGKTTVTRLLQGLNAQYEGMIKIDGMDLREIDLQHLRTNIGVVAQENFLFSGTIRENIGIAKPHATFSEIVRVAQLAGAEEFIERMPKGYETVLSEGAANLSGGQRQRLAIARALILDPPILILDEATSALDAESEAIINANLMRIADGRTIICVSHRLAMLVKANQIMVMEKGQVDDIGSHDELVHRNEIYKHMWFTQNPTSQVNNSGKIAAISA